MRTRVVLGAAGLAGAAIVIGQMNVGADPGRAIAPATDPGHAGGQGSSVMDGVGPDVIIGAIPSYSNYTAEGGIDAYSIGTTSCNIGDEPLAWFANTNQHPVIGQNLFRYKDGRFEHIGQSWLKHGFTALNGTLCGACQPTPGTSLGVMCSDPYSSGLNGNRTYLGPKFEVDAATGFFPYPYTSPPWSGDIARRLQVHQSDVTPPMSTGALYWVEGQYVHPEDAADTGRSINNASYRPVEFNSAGSIIGFLAPTFEQWPAIQAWSLIDPEVVFTELPLKVPDDGNFFVAYRVFDRGGNQWEYEYAVHNFDSDRSAGRFVVPVPDGVTLTDVGFHDVDYHSGEPWDGTDWSWDHSNDEMAWYTDTHGVNPDANAIRWGTLYNFRFTANSPPQDVTGRIHMFKPGTPDFIELTVAAPLPAQPCVEDINGDGVVNVFDLLEVLSNWGPAGGGGPADVNGDGTVNVFDLLAVLSAWGPC